MSVFWWSVKVYRQSVWCIVNVKIGKNGQFSLVYIMSPLSPFQHWYEWQTDAKLNISASNYSVGTKSENCIRRHLRSLTSSDLCWHRQGHDDSVYYERHLATPINIHITCRKKHRTSQVLGVEAARHASFAWPLCRGTGNTLKLGSKRLPGSKVTPTQN